MFLRSVSAAVLGLLAVLLAAVALPAAWLQQNVFDERGFVAFTGPMVEDAQFRAALSAAVARDAAGQLDGGPVLDALAKPAVERVAGRLTELDGFPQAWRDTAAQSHRLSLADPDRPDLAVQLAPLADLAAREVADVLGVQAPAARNLVVRFDDAGLNGYVAAAGRLASSWSWLAAGAAVAAVAVVLLAVRKATAVFWLGLGVAAAGLLLWVAAGRLPGLAGQVSGTALAEAFSMRAAQLAADGFQPWAAALAWAGAAAAAAGLLVRLLRPRTGRPGGSR
jgi:hypothetical protein